MKQTMHFEFNEKLLIHRRRKDKMKGCLIKLTICYNKEQRNKAIQDKKLNWAMF